MAKQRQNLLQILLTHQDEEEASPGLGLGTREEGHQKSKGNPQNVIGVFPAML